MPLDQANWVMNLQAANMGEEAEQIGLTTDQLQAYRLAAAQAGIEAEQMDAAMMRLARSWPQRRFADRVRSASVASRPPHPEIVRMTPSPAPTTSATWARTSATVSEAKMDWGN